MQKIKAVIFDLDGTLANTIPLCIEALRQAVEPLVKRPLSDEEIMATFGPTEEGSVRSLAPADYKKGTADFLHYYKTLHGMCNQPFEGMNDLLSTLQNKGVRLALATGKGKESTVITLQHFGFTRYFNCIETGSPTGSRKAEAIGIILDTLGDIQKEEAIYVGDSPADIKDSRKAGIAVVAAAWAATAKKEKLKALQPDELFDTIEDFASWLYPRV